MKRFLHINTRFLYYCKIHICKHFWGLASKLPCLWAFLDDETVEAGYVTRAFPLSITLQNRIDGILRKEK